MKKRSLIDRCYTRKGTNEFYRVTHLGVIDRPMGIVFCSGDGNRALATNVNFLVEQLVEITPQQFNKAWTAFVLGLANENVQIILAKKTKKPRREGKLNRNFP
jgi:hypothetical protein